MQLTVSIFVATSIMSCTAFVANPPGVGQHQKRMLTSVFGIAEWRDLVPNDGDDIMLKPIGILPSLSKDVLLQGQTKYLQITDKAEIQLMQQAIHEHARMIGMGLVMHDGVNVLPTMPLLEIEDYIHVGGNFGMFAKVRAVGRARLEQQQDSGRHVHSCREHFDSQGEAFGDSDYEEANVMADMAECLIAELSAIEKVTGIEVGESRLSRYQSAYDAALESDTQGYFMSSTQTRMSRRRSWQELAAVSWAIFSTSKLQEEDATFRLNAMNMQSIPDRLDFAMSWLEHVREVVEQEVSQ